MCDGFVVNLVMCLLQVKQCSHEMLDKYSDICRERIEELVEKQCDVLTLNEYYENSYYKIKDSVLRQERGRLRPEVGESSRGMRDIRALR